MVPRIDPRAIHHASIERLPSSRRARAHLGGPCRIRRRDLSLRGLYIPEDAFAHPLNAGAAAVICAAFIIALAAMLVFYLIKPTNGPPMVSHDHGPGSEAPAVMPGADPATAATRRDNSGNTLTYQRFYVDHSRIRPQTGLLVYARGIAGK